jgi:hypothetical protein
MQWTNDHKNRLFRLEENGTDLARIHLAEKGKGPNPFRVKVLVSFIYFGRITQRRLEKANKEWKVTARKFADRDRALGYIRVKKKEIEEFIRQREEA